MLLPAAILLGLCSQALAAELTLYLPAKPNPFALHPSTHATLSSLRQHESAPLSGVNTFVFRNLTADSYLVDVHCSTSWYQPLRVDVASDGSVEAWETFRGNDWGNKGEKLVIKEGSAGKGVELRALAAKNYFAERPKFSIVGILKNPMILMGLVSMVMVFGMPYLMENMDPETRAEFEARQKENPMSSLMGGGQQQNQSPLGNFDMAAYLAGSDKKDNGGSSKKR